MTEPLQIRESTARDRPLIEALYPAAFPEEDLLPLVRRLLACPACTHLSAVAGSRLVGHLALTIGAVDAWPRAAALLGPLAVAPAHQHRGIGTALMRAGLERLVGSGIGHALVLGDPAYYRRFGFEPEASIEPPFAIPDEWAEAWQSLSLRRDGATPSGKLSVPEPWLDPALWAP